MSEIYTNSIQLDNLISEKLKDCKFIYEIQSMSPDQLRNEINRLRYLLYMTNQDRLTLRSYLLNSSPFRQSTSSKLSLGLSLSKEFEDLNNFAFYENTGRVSEINTVINTSILPYSQENTEREFSPFSHSPIEPSHLPGSEPNPIGLLLTEVTTAKAEPKIRPSKQVKKPKQTSESNHLSSSQSNFNQSVTSEELDEISVGALNCSNYLMQLQGDDDEAPSFSEVHSREGSVNYEFGKFVN